MKPIGNLGDLLARAPDNGVFGTKMRSVIKLPGAGLDAVVEQQFDIARQILSAGLVPIIEPEVDIHSPRKAEAEDQLNAALLDGVNRLDDHTVMLKLTLPDSDNLYKQLVEHPNVLRVVALSGGYSRDDACERLARNHGVIASFSRTHRGTHRAAERRGVRRDTGRVDRHDRQGVQHLSSYWLGRAAALVVGALPALAFPAPSWWWLAWFGVVPLLLLVRAAPTALEGGVRAWCGMAGYVLTNQYWLLPSAGPLLVALAALLGALWLPWGGPRTDCCPRRSPSAGRWPPWSCCRARGCWRRRCDRGRVWAVRGLCSARRSGTNRQCWPRPHSAAYG